MVSPPRPMIFPTSAMSMGTGISSFAVLREAPPYAPPTPPPSPAESRAFAAAALFSAWCSRMISFTARAASATTAAAPVM